MRGRSGYLRQPFGNGQVIWHPEAEYWWLEAPRGKDPLASADWWGPWCNPDESKARAALTEWQARLEKVGWFRQERQATGAYDVDAMQAMVARLPRLPVVPDYFRVTRDHLEAEARTARHGNTLHLGGSDLFLDAKRSWAPLDRVTNRVHLVAKKPGDHHALTRNVSFDLDANSLDTLIEFLIDVRKSVVTEEAFQAACRTAYPMPPGQDADAPAGGTDDAERFARMASTVKAMNEVILGLFEGAEKRPADLQLFSMILQILGRGDRISGIDVEPGSDGPSVVDVRAGLETRTAQEFALLAMPVDGKAN